ncbi:transposase [Pseudomonas sp. EpS/L25]|uniref:transposase n=1 Tax=Pseudomonas sp. EpS/L25 TaxID=1749078 RepID=UPI003FA6D5CC
MLSRHLLALLHRRDFSSARQCTAFVGLVPRPWQSGKSVQGRTVPSKAGSPRIRAKLYRGAIVAKGMYERLLARGKPRMSALGAAVRKLLQIAYGVLKTQHLINHDRPFSGPVVIGGREGIYEIDPGTVGLRLRSTQPAAPRQPDNARSAGAFVGWAETAPSPKPNRELNRSTVGLCCAQPNLRSSYLTLVTITACPVKRSFPGGRPDALRRLRDVRCFSGRAPSTSCGRR